MKAFMKKLKEIRRFLYSVLPWHGAATTEYENLKSIYERWVPWLLNDNQSVEFGSKATLKSFHISDELEIEMFRSAKDISTIIKNDGEKLCL